MASLVALQCCFICFLSPTPFGAISLCLNAVTPIRVTHHLLLIVIYALCCLIFSIYITPSSRACKSMLRRSLGSLERSAHAYNRYTRRQKLDEAIRVDQAGEVGAVRICKYQLLWLSPLDSSVPIVKEILGDEVVHEKVMNDLAHKHSVQLTSLDPLFHFGAFALGSVTALLGKEAVMCCHAAVEVTIAQHYNDQLRELQVLESDSILQDDEAKNWKEVKDYIAQFRDEEKHHQELGEQNGAREAPVYPVLYNGIRMICRLGVSLAKRI
uniref:5-demethoxyubiquinone hydroxylase, mitochondrial n=1 Tax=Trypanosoma congolense (strain IL3000) TaxID=1068625 RepID=F9W8H6_TRYCI|nr:unnamed protein product [Trypanosoma congolense IL3000]